MYIYMSAAVVFLAEHWQSSGPCNSISTRSHWQHSPKAFSFSDCYTWAKIKAQYFNHLLHYIPLFFLYHTIITMKAYTDLKHASAASRQENWDLHGIPSKRSTENKRRHNLIKESLQFLCSAPSHWLHTPHEYTDFFCLGDSSCSLALLDHGSSHHQPAPGTLPGWPVNVAVLLCSHCCWIPL